MAKLLSTAKERSITAPDSFSLPIYCCRRRGFYLTVFPTAYISPRQKQPVIPLQPQQYYTQSIPACKTHQTATQNCLQKKKSRWASFFCFLPCPQENAFYSLEVQWQYYQQLSLSTVVIQKVELVGLGLTAKCITQIRKDYHVHHEFNQGYGIFHEKAAPHTKKRRDFFPSKSNLLSNHFLPFSGHFQPI